MLVPAHAHRAQRRGSAELHTLYFPPCIAGGRAELEAEIVWNSVLSAGPTADATNYFR